MSSLLLFDVLIVAVVFGLGLLELRNVRRARRAESRREGFEQQP